MARQKSDDARSGWQSRRAQARGRKSRVSDADKQLGNALRGAMLAQMRGDGEGEGTFNAEVQTSDPGPGDFIAALSDADLMAYYEQLTGRKPNGKAKRPNIEAAVRKAEAERSAAKQADAKSVDLDAADAYADDDLIEGDDV